jgi:hypothetical protein
MSYAPQRCPQCAVDLVPFTDLDEGVREELEDDPTRQRQSVSHRRRKHTVCPECTLEIHGCGQPYAVPQVQ